MASTPRVIAICGKRRSGKNTAGTVIRETLAADEGMHAEELAFADPIKRCVGELFGFSKEQLDGELKEEPDGRWGGTTPRRVLQFFGTEMMQFKLQELIPGIGRHFWTRCLVEKIRTMPPGTVAIVTDLRFRHEWEALREAFGEAAVCLKVLRADDENATSTTETSTHSSETDMDGVIADAVVHNVSGDLEGFRASVVQATMSRCRRVKREIA